MYGMDESDSRNERMLIKAAGHLGDSNHRWNEGAGAGMVRWVVRWMVR